MRRPAAACYAAAAARPVFLRLRPALESTGTFKAVKAGLARDGFDPAEISDPLFALDRAGGGYVPLDNVPFGRIRGGGVRL